MIANLRREHPLPGVVGAVVKLQRAGNELKACCPFHSDKAPSFTIYHGGDRFQCFGCGAQGDVFDFLGRLHGVGLREAADMLAGGDLDAAIEHLVDAGWLIAKESREGDKPGRKRSDYAVNPAVHGDGK